MLWFVKSRRAQSKDDYETWLGGGVVPTLNAFENANDTRATVIIFDTGSHGDGIRMSDETVPKLQARMGTGGNNTPMVAYEPVAFSQNQREEVRTMELAGALAAEKGTHQQTFIAYPIQDGREMEKTQNGLGIGNGGDPSYTVDTTGAQSVAFDKMNFTTTAMHQTLRAGTPQSTGAVVPPSTVRRLTPTECERLQGFPDGWTAERIDEVWGLDTQADSARYKQMGNAVAVPCVEWIVNRLVEIDRDR